MQQLLNPKCVFDEVIVSTEDKEIQEVVNNTQATLHVRSADLAQDTSTVVQVCLDVLDKFKCDWFCCVYATAALLKPGSLISSLNMLESDQLIDVLMSTSNYNYSPFEALKINENGYAEMLMPEYHKVQSQFQPKVCVDAGTFYWARTSTFLKEKTFYSERLKLFNLDSSESCDLDTAEDFEELKLKFKKV